MVRGLYSATDIILQCGSLGKIEQATLVLELLSNQPPTDPTQHPLHISPSLYPSIEPINILFWTA